MTKINCHITEAIQKDFSSLWTCKQRGKTVEISTPYLLPDSTLLSLFITERNKKIIIHDGGSISQIVSEHCRLPDDEIKALLDGFSAQHGINHTIGANKQKIFFKACDKKKLISSAAFDLASFAMTATNGLVAASIDEPDLELDKRFQRIADIFIKTVTHSTGLKFKPRQEIREFPGIKFSGVINNSSTFWIVYYVTGSELGYFRRSLAETIVNFGHVWKSKQTILKHIGRTIPVLNTNAGGYKPDKLDWQIKDLKDAAAGTLLPWSTKESLLELLKH